MSSSTSPIDRSFSGPATLCAQFEIQGEPQNKQPRIKSNQYCVEILKGCKIKTYTLFDLIISEFNSQRDESSSDTFNKFYRPIDPSLPQQDEPLQLGDRVTDTALPPCAVKLQFTKDMLEDLKRLLKVSKIG